jgi:hypothetical protein
MYADIRRTVGGIQFTVGPLANGWPMVLRLSYETAAALADALTGDTRWGHMLASIGPDRYVSGLIYEPGDGGGWISYVRVNVDQADDQGEVLAEWGCAAASLLEIAAELRNYAPDKLPPLPGDPAEPWEPEDFHLCSGCGRPVFDSMASAMVVTSRGLGFMCGPCGIREMEAAEAAQ